MNSQEIEEFEKQQEKRKQEFLDSIKFVLSFTDFNVQIPKIENRNEGLHIPTKVTVTFQLREKEYSDGSYVTFDQAFKLQKLLSRLCKETAINVTRHE